MTTLEAHKSGAAITLAQQGFKFPKPLPEEDPITGWILTMLTPMDATLALVLTQGSRWSVDPAALKDRMDLLYQLRALLTEWVQLVWFSRQFEKTEREHDAAGTKMMMVKYLTWARNLKDLEDLELRISHKITEFGA